MLLQGLFVPLTCPFYRDGASYLRKLEHNVGRYSLGPVAGLVTLAPGGESGALTDAESESFLNSVAEFAGKAKVLIAGVQRASVHAALTTAETAARYDFDAVLLSPPADWAQLVRGNDARELLLYYTSVADRSPLPVVLLSDAKPPALQLPAEVIANLAHHPNIIGLMDADLTVARMAELLEATNDVRREVTVTTVFEAVTRRMLGSDDISRVESSGMISVASLSGGTALASASAVSPPPAPALKTRVKEVGFQILSAGFAHSVLPLLNAGVSGAMPWLSACAPQACFEAYAAWKDGDHALAEERAARLAEAELLLQRLGPAAVKAGCDFNGYFGGVPRLPRLPLTAEDRATVEQALREIRN